MPPTLRFAPHPDLEGGARKAIELDYGMKDGEASITTRVCLSYYLERQFGAMMAEAIALGNALGLGLTIRPDERLAQTRTLGAIKTSMLQDVQAGRPIELDGIVGATVEIAERLGVAMPAIDAVYGAVRVRAAMLGLYRPQ